MSIASISYGSLKDASGEAKAVAKKLDRYADAIHDSVYRKLNSYSGKWSSNLSTAKSKANSKISALRAEANKYERYSADLIDLKERCQATDKSVKSKVSSLTAAFKDNHGIKNNKVVNAISYFFTSVGNSTSLGRWLGDGKDQFDAGVDFFKGAISEWYNFEGGEDFLKGSLVAVLEIAIGVVAVVGAILTGGALLLVIAGVVAGAIAIYNGYANLYNEGRALYSTWGRDDPATGKRRSEINTWQDYLRKETDSRFWHGVATGIDMVNIVCSIVSVGGGLSNLAKKGFKWTTGSLESLDDLKIRDILTRGNFRSFAGKLKTSIGEVWTKISSPIKMRDWTALQYNFKTGAYDFATDFGKNLKSKYLDFSEAKKGVKSTKTILETIFVFAKGGHSFKNVGKTGVPIIPIAGLPGGGFIDVGDFKSIYDNSLKVFKSPIFADDAPINSNIMEKLSKQSKINISVPDLHIPEIGMGMPNRKVA